MYFLLKKHANFLPLTTLEEFGQNFTGLSVNVGASSLKVNVFGVQEHEFSFTGSNTPLNEN